MRWLLRVTGWILTFLPLVAIVAGANRFDRRSRGERLLWIFMLAVLLQNLTMAWFGAHGVPNSFIAQLNQPVLVGLGVFTFAAMMNSDASRRMTCLAFALFLPIWLWRQLRLDFQQDFAVVVGPLGHLVLATAGLLLIRDRLSRIEGPPLRDTGLLAGLGAVLIWAPTAALAPIGAMVHPHDPELTVRLYLLRVPFMIVGYLLFCAVFLWANPSRSSPGPTWSPAPASGSSSR